MSAPSARPQRVLHVIDGLGVGGAEVQLALLLSHLPADRFTHAVCHVGPRADVAARIRGLGVSVHDLSHRGRRAPGRGVLRLLRIARGFRPHLVHTDGLYANLYGRTVGAATRTPVLTTVGNTVAPPVRRRVPRTRSEMLHLALAVANLATARRSRHIMAISEAVRASVLRLYRLPPERVTVVPRGVALDQIVPAPAGVLGPLRDEVAPPDAWPVLLSVGRLAVQKGQEYLIRALPAVRRRFGRAHLLLVGDGPLATHYRDVAAQAGVSGAVSLLGRRQDVPLLLQAADIFVFPSLYEGTGVSLLEAMAWGRPFVASRIPAIEEVADGCGHLVAPRDPQALAEGIILLAEHPERWSALSAQNRQLIAQRFDIRRNAVLFADLLERVARGDRRQVRS